jgi:hypothetical protein
VPVSMALMLPSSIVSSSPSSIIVMRTLKSIVIFFGSPRTIISRQGRCCDSKECLARGMRLSFPRGWSSAIELPDCRRGVGGLAANPDQLEERQRGPACASASHSTSLRVRERVSYINNVGCFQSSMAGWQAKYHPGIFPKKCKRVRKRLKRMKLWVGQPAMRLAVSIEFQWEELRCTQLFSERVRNCLCRKRV